MSQDITENIGQRVRELIVERLRLSIDPGELSDDEPLFA